MNFPDRSRDPNGDSNNRTTDPKNRAEVELLGGEPLAGSGFEDESPVPEIQDLNAAQHSSKAGRE